MRIKNVLVAGAALSSAVALASPAAAAASADTTGPTLTATREAQFPVGATVQNERGLGTYTGLDLLLQWSAKDPSGICGYDLFREYVGAPETKLLSNSTDTAYLGAIDDYDDAQGGGSQSISGYRVVAHDCAGNTTSRKVGSQPVVVQENGAHHIPETSSRPTALKVSYSGSWTTQTGAGFSRGAQRVTTTAGSAVTFKATLVPGSQFAVVSSSYGVGDLYVDGAKVATIAGADQPREIVFNRRLGGGTHTVKIVAKSGGFALDAFLVS